MASCSLDNELNSLKSTLSQGRDKIINQWTGEELHRLMSEASQQHEQFLHRSNEEILQRQADIEDLRKKAACGHQSLEERVQSIEQLKSELQQLVSETDDVLRARENASAEIEDAKVVLGRDEELLKKEGKGTLGKLDELEKASAMFRERLCFSMKKTRESWIQFIFRSIDHEDPDKPFYFFLKIVGEERQYTVRDCDPPVDELPDLLEKLNKTNNLKSFIVAMRKRFKTMAVSDKKR